jgi:hypothetical protein
LSAQRLSEADRVVACVDASRPLGAEVVDVDYGQLVGRRLKDVTVVVDRHELAAVSRRDTGG